MKKNAVLLAILIISFLNYNELSAIEKSRHHLSNQNPNLDNLEFKRIKTKGTEIEKILKSEDLIGRWADGVCNSVEVINDTAY